MQNHKDRVNSFSSFIICFLLFSFCSVTHTLHFRTSFRYIRRGKPDAGFPLFESESLKWPGFVEFDDVNGKVLTYSAQDR